MEAKLIKNKYGDDFYYLMVDINTYATTHKESFRILSLKNCQAIELGYDLDELAKKACPDVISSANSAYKAGFQKALEILGNKKFSDRDVILIAEYVRVASQSTPDTRTKDLFDEYQSLQQTEWDIEIEMICPHPMDTYRCGLKYGCDGDGCNHPEQVPYLDADGCLILRKI